LTKLKKKHVMGQPTIGGNATNQAFSFASSCVRSIIAGMHVNTHTNAPRMSDTSNRRFVSNFMSALFSCGSDLPFLYDQGRRINVWTQMTVRV
jgi:hypothetical protein